MAGNSPYYSSPAHSRSSSGASNTSSPIASTFSRNHNRFPSSSSSLATTPDSPVNLTKSALHDLVEDPAEREDGFLDLPANRTDEPLCICDTPFCEHMQTPRVSEVATPTSCTPEWTAGDEYFGDDGNLPGTRTSKRRKSIEQSNESLTSRLSRRWPSISARWRDRRPTTSVSDPKIQSAPPSRSSSVRLPALRHSLIAHLDPNQMLTPPETPTDGQPELNELRRPRGLSRASKPIDIMIPEHTFDSAEQQELISTPLLPPMMAEHVGHSQETLQSPLQSPSVAEPGNISLLGTPAMTPLSTGIPTPPLSSRPSMASFGVGRALQPSADIPAMSISTESDPWAMKLGHANFHITPEPYYPGVCDLSACKRLLDDWESARAEFMRQASRISEHYGPTSQIYKFTELKWAEIDAVWRANHESANNEAGVSTETTLYQPLAETTALSLMPSLNDPQQPSKFPKIDDADIVGPMVKYTKIQRQPSRKPAFLKLFTDPASLLGMRSPFAIKR
ncbi:hypothetical protein LTR56_019532 [Elasticomyces elasticus]|nr:hypothetical protein LTR56_019532 [Elasticomyces elasticus]KAK3653743.1 hypothetical protein LTR22_011121 [Elasticomyces elasticus]KAK4924148.1 hypothetical protein LTR49_008668 [Elasticomyces elasticus]KAK5758496.1 hypothetical protein LTS12_011359 [Elasticomyces elasticus]